MISIGNVVSVADGVRYFEEAVADSQIDYYAARGEAPGVWRGCAAPALGLQGRVTRDDLVRVLEGRDPGSAEELGRHFGMRKNVAFDVTFSLPKSVSLLYVLGDELVRGAVMRALEAGTAAAHDYLERQAGWGRVYDRANDSMERVRAEFVTASFVHRTARPVTRDGVTTVDPQLHTHLLISSFVRRANGSWGQLYSEPLYAHAAAAGALGQAATRDALVRDLGVRVRTNPNGTFELEGFTPEQLAEFSQRHRQAIAAAAAVGTTSLRGTKVAVLDTRETKREVDVGSDLFDHWLDRAVRVGLERECVPGLLGQEQVRDPRWFDVDTVQQVVGRGERGLTSQASVFTRRDLVRSLASHAPLGMSPEGIEQLADAILAEAALVTPMVPPGAPGQSPREAMRRWIERGMEVHYSTAEVVALERRMLASARARCAEGTAKLAPDVVNAACERSERRLTDGQRAMVEAVCASPDGVVVVEGAAGVGKTAAARVIRNAYRSQDVPIVGCAPSGRAAVALENEAGIPSFTTASLLMRLRVGEQLPVAGVVVADECSMLGPDLAELVLQAERHRTKLVLVGDSEQLQPVDGGALFRSLGDHLGRVEVTEVIRQAEEWDRQVLIALRAGRAAPLVQRYLAEGRVHTVDDEAARVGTMAADWIAATRSGLDTIIVARERAAVVALNAVTRAAAVDAGMVSGKGVRRECVDSVGAKPLPLGELEFAPGDRVLVVGKNRRRLGLVKGLRGTVTDVRADGTVLFETEAVGHSRVVCVPPTYDGLSHGYALTAHRAQGATADVALVHGSDAADRQWQYVALSRHRIRAAYYDVVPPRRDIDGVHHQPRAPEPTLEQRLLASMTRDGRKASTLDYPREYDRQLLQAHAATGHHGGLSAAPSERQLDLLAENGMLEELPAVATWVHASLLIDDIVGGPSGVQARAWLAEGGAPDEEANRVIALARNDLSAGRRRWTINRSTPRGARTSDTPGASTAAGDADDARRRADLQRSRDLQLQRERETAAQRHREQCRGRAIG